MEGWGSFPSPFTHVITRSLGFYVLSKPIPCQVRATSLPEMRSYSCPKVLFVLFSLLFLCLFEYLKTLSALLSFSLRSLLLLSLSLPATSLIPTLGLSPGLLRPAPQGCSSSREVEVEPAILRGVPPQGCSLLGSLMFIFCTRPYPAFLQAMLAFTALESRAPPLLTRGRPVCSLALPAPRNGAGFFGSHRNLDGEGGGGRVSPSLGETRVWSCVPFSNQGHGNEVLGLHLETLWRFGPESLVSI